MSPRQEDSEFTLRHPAREDAAEVWRLVHDLQTLDRNSCYTYLLLCSDFADTCVIATSDRELAGFVTAYRPPPRPDVIFVWQIGVATAARGQGLAKRLLNAVVSMPSCADTRFLEATVTPSNVASQRLFEALARQYDVPCQVQPGFDASLFRYGEEHEDENRIRIGPLPERESKELEQL